MVEYFFGYNDYRSNFFARGFYFPPLGRRVACAESALQAGKPALARNRQLMMDVATTTRAADAKKKASPPVCDLEADKLQLWDSGYDYEWLTLVLYWKFQDRDLRARLLATDPARLVEASKYDGKYGAKADEATIRRNDGNFSGANLMGQALEEIRGLLRLPQEFGVFHRWRYRWVGDQQWSVTATSDAMRSDFVDEDLATYEIQPVSIRWGWVLADMDIDAGYVEPPASPSPPRSRDDAS